MDVQGHKNSSLGSIQLQYPILICLGFDFLTTKPTSGMQLQGEKKALTNDQPTKAGKTPADGANNQR